ncbi:MAG: regulatory iron-sulfur-containing complex subunit RicT [Sphaerochaetaceae bacterium]
MAKNKSAGVNSVQENQKKEKPSKGYLYVIKNPSSKEVAVCASPDLLLKGTHVIGPTKYGLDYAVVVGPARSQETYQPGSSSFQAAVCPQSVEEELPVFIGDNVEWIESIATDDDYNRFLELQEMEKEALSLCLEKVNAHNLDMKLVSAHYLFGEPKIIFFFTAANRVDFRELVKDLVSIFRIRIELRQIGVRDESRLLGGLAVCGRAYCCHAITDKLNPVSIKMAKEQNLSLNSTKISGPCGRLLCCLSYEYDFYAQERENLPQEGYRLRIEKESMKVIEVNILTRKLTLAGPEGNLMSLPFSALEYNSGTNHWEISREYLREIRSN